MALSQLIPQISGGDVLVSSGHSAQFASGRVVVRSAHSGEFGGSGDIIVTTGDAAIAAAAGSVYIRAGDHKGTGDGGSVTIRPGASARTDVANGASLTLADAGGDARVTVTAAGGVAISAAAGEGIALDGNVSVSGTAPLRAPFRHTARTLTATGPSPLTAGLLLCDGTASVTVTISAPTAGDELHISALNGNGCVAVVDTGVDFFDGFIKTTITMAAEGDTVTLLAVSARRYVVLSTVGSTVVS